MKRIFVLMIIATFFLFSCSKNDSGNFIFEKTWQEGRAEDVICTRDTMYILCGEAAGSPFVIKLNRSGSRIMEYTNENTGAYTSVLEDTSGIYAAGYTNGDILISKIDVNGEEDWSLTVSTSSNTGRSVIKKYDDNSFLVVGSAHVDSLDADGFKMLAVDRSGNITGETTVEPGYKVAVSDFEISASGKIYTALAKSIEGAKSRAAVAEITAGGNILWEGELYNNEKFAAACIAMEISESGEIYVAGRTELNIDNNTLENSFLANLAATGSVINKEYLESSNCGVDIGFDDFDRVHILNRNCFIVNILGPAGAGDESRLRTFEVCDPYETDTHASAMEINIDGNYIMCGEQSGKVYYSLRKAEEPVEEQTE